jgi:biopolymer transport protein ExbD
MGAKVGGASGGGMDEINVTPLIDVVLVLLIIFMVLTPITLTKMATELPPETEDEPPPPPDPNQDQLLVAVYKDNTMALNLIPVDAAKLEAELKKRLKNRPKDKRVVFIDGHPDASYEIVVNTIDQIRDCGAERVGFAEMKDDGPSQLTPEQVQMMAAGTLALPGSAAPAPAAP